MASPDVDYTLLQGVKLLHSKAPDARDQLKALLDDALAQRRSTLKLPPVNKERSKSDAPFRPIKEPEKRFEKLVKPLKPDYLDVPIELKRIRVESPIAVIKSRSLTSSPEPSSSRPSTFTTPSEDSKDAEIIPEKVEEDSEATDIEETDAGEFALEMGLACVVCKQIDVQPGNQLVECQDCHNLYHQECHRPPATEQDISDPRSVWYCAKCTKTQKKITTKTTKLTPTKPTNGMSASSAFQAAINQGKESAMQLVKAAKEKAQESTSPVVQPFKRTELKSPLPGGGSSSPFSQAKPIGLAGLANISRTVTATTSTSSSSSSSSNSTPSASVTSNADKRLQLMKKKAAKANEKKRIGGK